MVSSIDLVFASGRNSHSKLVAPVVLSFRADDCTFEETVSCSRHGLNPSEYALDVCVHCSAMVSPYLDASEAGN
jgi:hypothetical protein